MKISIAFTLLAVLALSACKAPAPPLTDDTLVTSSVDGVTLTHRYAIHAPQSFTPVNETYRALYNASVMTRPDYGGKVVGHLENGKPFIVLGEVENHWLAIAEPEPAPQPEPEKEAKPEAEQDKKAEPAKEAEADSAQAAPKMPQLLGYVPFKAGVKSELYEATLRSDRPRPRKTKKVCVDVGGQSKACRSNDTATWILE